MLGPSLGDEERTEVDEAKAFLLEELGQGPRPARDIIKLGRDIASERTLRKAKAAAGVKSQKAAFGGGWEWLLPAAPEGCNTPLAALEDGEGCSLGENPAVMRDSAPSEAPEEPEGCTSNGMTALGRNGLPKSERERAALRDRVNRERVEKEEREQRQKDAALAAEELGALTLDELQERLG